jgi:hypothetical protein
VSDLRRLKELEDENRRLKKMVADQALNIEALKMVAEEISKARAADKCGAGRTGTIRSLGARGVPLARRRPQAVPLCVTPPTR